MENCGLDRIGSDGGDAFDQDGVKEPSTMDPSHRTLVIKRPNGSELKFVFPTVEARRRLLDGGPEALKNLIQSVQSNPATGLSPAAKLSLAAGLNPAAGLNLAAGLNPAPGTNVPGHLSHQPSGTLMRHPLRDLGNLEHVPPRHNVMEQVPPRHTVMGQVLPQNVMRQVPPQTVVRQATTSLKPFIEDDDTILALLKELILRRDVTTGPRINKSVMDSVLNALHVQKIMYTAEKVVYRKKCLLKYYKERKRLNETSWRFFDLVGQLVGDVEFNGVFAELKTSTDRIIFDVNATNLLIFEYSKRKAIFDKVSNHRQLWEEIACEINITFPNLNATWEACERKWSLLKATFKDLRERSGDDSSAIEWTFYDSMNLAIGQSVGVEPKFCFAVGTKTVVKKRNEVVTTENTEQTLLRQPKKPRLSNAAKKLALEEKKLALQQEYLSLLSKKILQNERNND